MLFSSLLPGGSEGLEVKQLIIKPDAVTLVLQSVASVGICPVCDQPSGKVHSHYIRSLSDLPWHGVVVRIRLHVRRFFCSTASCERKIFAERLPGVTKAFAHKTDQLTDSLRRIGFACGGEGGARLAAELGMPASGDTLLRLMRQASASEVPVVTVLGVDDWAWRKGQRYGTILCDLATHQTVDLLPERSAQMFSSWLQEHPGVQVISRDRAGYYAQGGADGAPAAVQVADRFHLVHNIHETLSRVVDRHHHELREATAEVNRRQQQEKPQPSAPPPATLPTHVLTSKQLVSRARRLWLYQQITNRSEQKQSMRSIARQLDVDRETVSRFLRAGGPPQRAARPYRCRVDRFGPYLLKRWQEGCHNAAQLTRELAAQGFEGSYFAIRRKLARLRLLNRGDTCAVGPSLLAMRTPSPKSAAWLLLKEEHELEEQGRQMREVLVRRCAEIRAAQDLAREFLWIVRQRQCGALDGWVAKACGAGAPRELQVFAAVLKRDYLAVRASLTLHWSNGQVEGQINKLKLIKRQMYGRARFDLLRQRVLHAA